MRTFAEYFDGKKEQAKFDAERKDDIERGPCVGAQAMPGPGPIEGGGLHGMGAIASVERAFDRARADRGNRVGRATLADRFIARRQMLRDQVGVREEQDRVNAEFEELERLLEANPDTARIFELMVDLYLIRS